MPLRVIAMDDTSPVFPITKPLNSPDCEPFTARQTETPSASCGAERQRFASNIVDPR